PGSLEGVEQDIQQALCGTPGDSWPGNPGHDWPGNAATAPTPYVMVPIGDDLNCMTAVLPEALENWNNGSQKCNDTSPQIIAAVATVEQYMQLVAFHQKDLQIHNLNQQMPPNPPKDPLKDPPANPYWTGYYASRPALKKYMTEGTRALLGAETFAAIGMRPPAVYGTSQLR